MFHQNMPSFDLEDFVNEFDLGAGAAANVALKCAVSVFGSQSTGWGLAHK